MVWSVHGPAARHFLFASRNARSDGTIQWDFLVPASQLGVCTRASERLTELKDFLLQACSFRIGVPGG